MGSGAFELKTVLSKISADQIEDHTQLCLKRTTIELEADGIDGEIRDESEEMLKKVEALERFFIFLLSSHL